MTSRAGRWEGFFAAPARRPWLTLAVTGVVLVLSVLGVSRMRPNATLGAVFGGHDPVATAMGRILSDFPAADEVLVLVTDPGAGDASESAARLHRYGTRFEAALRASPRAAELVSHITWAADQEFIDYFTKVVAPEGVYYLGNIQPLIDRLRPEEMKAQIQRNEAMIAAPGPGAGALAKQLLKDPLRFRELVDDSMRQSLAAPIRTYNGGPEFISEDGRSLLIRVGGRRPVSDLDHATAITSLVQGVVDGGGAGAADHLRVELSGAYPIAAASAKAMRSDMGSNIWGSLVAFQILFLLAYRGVLSFLLAIVPVIIGNLAAFGAFSLHSTDITPIVAVIGSLLAGLGIEYSVHYLTQYEAFRAEGLDPIRACGRTGADLFPPVLVGCGTSVIGFMSVILSNVVSIRSFAVLGSLGLALTVAATLAMMPAMLVLVDRYAPGLVRNKGARFGAEWLVRIAAARPRMWIGVSAVAAAVALTIVIAHPTGALRFESDLSVMHARPNPPLEAQQRIADKFGDVAESLFVYISANSADELVSRAHEVQRRLQDPAVKAAGAQRSIGLASLLPDPAARSGRDRELQAIDPERAVRDFKAAIAESAFSEDAYAGFIEALPRMLRPRAEDYPSLATLRQYPSVAGMLLPREQGGGFQAVTMVLIDHPLNDARDRDAALDALNGALKGLPGVVPTGLAAVSRSVEETVRHDMPYQTAVAAALVALCNFLFLRRLGSALLSYVPVTCAVLAILAYMTAFHERINLANMIAVPLIFGLGIDFGLFTIQVGRQCRAEGAPVSTLVARLGHSSHAFFINTLTTILGFGTLVFTSSPALQSLGRIMSVAVTACMLGTSFVVVPVVVRGMRGGRRVRTERTQ